MIIAIKSADAATLLYLLGQDGNRAHEYSWESGRTLSAQILAKIQELFSAASLELTDLPGGIIFSGPGSFTSLRIGHAVANALADSLSIPVVGSVGQQWVEEGIKALVSASPGRPALPHYGADAHITRPKP